MNKIAVFFALVAMQCGYCGTLSSEMTMAGVVTENVAEGQERTENREVFLTADQTLVKTDAGKLVLPESVQSQRTALNVSVQEGTLELDASGSAASDFEPLPESIKSKMSIWLSVADSPMVKNGTAVESWYDVRETDTEIPKFPYAVAEHWDGAAAPVFKVGECVSYRGNVTNRMQCLYFNGYGSGTAMAIKNADGTEFKSCPYEWFAVHGVNESWGNLFGWACDRRGNVPPLAYIMENTAEKSLGFGFGWVSAYGPVMGDAALWVDGRPADMTASIEKGFHVVDLHRNTVSDINLFRSYGLGFYSYSSDPSAVADSKKWKGGDYLCEVIGIRTALSESERALITSYLTRKWFGALKTPKDIAVADGATVAVSTPAGQETAFDVRVRGTGSFTKDGTGRLVYNPTVRAAGDEAPLSLSAGEVKRVGHLALSVATGSRVTASAQVYDATTKYGTNVLSVTADAGAGQIVKDGPLAATLTDIPDDATKLVVTEGSLSLRPSMVGTARFAQYEIPLVNCSFEDWPASVVPADKPERFNLNTVSGFPGWACDQSSNIMLFNLEVWPTHPGSLSIEGYNLTHTTNGIPDGVCIMGVKGVNSVIYQVVTIPEDGEYELSAMINGRALEANYSSFNLAYLADNTSAMTPRFEFGYFTYGKNEWMRQSLRQQVRAGTYRLCLKGFAMPQSTDTMVCYDDIHLVKVGPFKTEWKIPYGDFEGCSNGMKSGMLCAWTPIEFKQPDWTLPGWTFDGTIYNTYYANGRACASGIGMASRLEGSAFNGRRLPLGGLYQLLFRTPSSVSTVFTPPEGKWYLKCYVGNWRQVDKGRLAARVTVGGSSKELGTLAIPAARLMNPHVWEIPFEADGAQEVSLTLTYSLSDGSKAEYGCHVDDITLVGEYENDDELLSNPSFETSLWPIISGTHVKVPESLNPLQRQYGGPSEYTYYGTGRGSGNWFAEILSDNGIYQDVVLPHDGWYRLGFLIKSRISNTLVAAPVKVMVVQNGETNLLGVVQGVARGVFEEQVFDFKAQAGACRVMVRNDSTGNEQYNDLDDFSLKYVGAAKPAPAALPAALDIRMSEGTVLSLEYDGTKDVHSFKAGGKSYRGIINRLNCPYLAGDGELNVLPPDSGLMLILR